MLFRMVCLQRIFLLHLRPVRHFVSSTSSQPLLIDYGYCSGYFYSVSSTRWPYQYLMCNPKFHFLLNPLTMQSIIPFIPIWNLLLSCRVIFQLLVKFFLFLRTSMC